MIISVFPNLNNKGVSVLAVHVVNKLISGGAEVYLSEEHEAVFTETKALKISPQSLIVLKISP